MELQTKLLLLQTTTNKILSFSLLKLNLLKVGRQVHKGYIISKIYLFYCE